MDADLQKAHLQLMQVSQPEELFGSEDVVLPEETLLGYLTREYDRFKKVTDPALYHDPEDVDAARDADAKLEQLYALAQRRIKSHVYGMEGRGKNRPVYATKSFNVGDNRYYIGRQIANGVHSVLYEGFMERDGVMLGEVVLKIAKDTAQNSFAQIEARNLDILHERRVPQWKHLPFVIDRFQSGGRIGLVLRKISGFSLTQVRQHRAHRDGVVPKHMVWMLDRLLSALGYVHHQGIVHGDLGPDHVLVQPPNHNAIICGWSAGAHEPAKSGEKVIITPSDFTAPEVRDHGKIGPWSDIYSLGKLMIWVLGGDPAQNLIPEAVDEPLARFLLSLVNEDPLVRPSEAWELYDQQCEIKIALWGKRKFLHFDMA